MLLKYSAIARGTLVLCSCQLDRDGNFEQVVTNILPNIPTTSDAKTSYTSNNNVTFNVQVDGGLIYLCASDNSATRTQTFQFLEEIKQRFTEVGLTGRAQFAGPHELDTDFYSVLSTQMNKYNGAKDGGRSSDALSRVQQQVEDVKGVMTRNIEQVLERGQRLEELMDRTTELEASASTFQTTARRVRRHMCCRNARMTIILIVVSIVVLLVLILIILFSTGVLPATGGGGSGPTPSTTTTTPAPSSASN